MANSVPDFLVHNVKDSVGVVVVESVNAWNNMTGWVMDTDQTIANSAPDAILQPWANGSLS